MIREGVCYAFGKALDSDIVDRHHAGRVPTDTKPYFATLKRRAPIAVVPAFVRHLAVNQDFDLCSELNNFDMVSLASLQAGVG